MILDAHGREMVPAIQAHGYDGARSTRLHPKTGVAYLALDEDHLVGSFDLGRLRGLCLHLRRNNAVVAGVVERFADHVVGPAGIVPQAKTEDDRFNDEAEEFWWEWAKTADCRQRVGMRDLQRFAVQARLLAGDMGFVLLANGQVQPIEAGRIDTPASLRAEEDIVHGVKLGGGGIPTHYYVLTRSKAGNLDKDNFRRIAAENFVFLHNPLRPDQVRGIPELAPVLNTITDFGRFQEEVLNKATLDAMHAWAIYTEDGAAKAAANAGFRPGFGGASAGGGEGGEKTQSFERFAGGQNYYLRPGEKIESLASNTPNGQFLGYTEMLLRIIGAAISLPYEFLLLDFKGGSFSASRAALMTTYRTFSMWQRWLIDGMLQRLWNWRIAKAIREGDIRPAPVDRRTGWSTWYKVAWATPRYDWLDPRAEANANAAKYALGAETLTSIVHATGRDIEDVMREKAGEIRRAMALAAEIAAETGQTNLTWRDIIGGGSFANTAGGETKAAEE